MHRPQPSSQLVVIVTQEAGDTVDNDLGRRTLRTPHHRSAARQRLDHRHAEGFRPANWVQERHGTAEQSALIRSAQLAEVDDVVTQVGSDELVEVFALMQFVHLGRNPQLHAGRAGDANRTMHALLWGHARENGDVATLACTEWKVAEIDAMVDHASNGQVGGCCMRIRDGDQAHVMRGGPKDCGHRARERHVIGGHYRKVGEASCVHRSGEGVVVNHVAVLHQLVGADGVLEFNRRTAHPNGVDRGHHRGSRHRAGRTWMADKQHLVTGSVQAAGQRVHNGLRAAVRRRGNRQPRRRNQSDPHQRALRCAAASRDRPGRFHTEKR